jgi:hypothetical protein
MTIRPAKVRPHGEGENCLIQPFIKLAGRTMRTSLTPSQGRGLLWGARDQGVPHRRYSTGNDPMKV